MKSVFIVMGLLIAFKDVESFVRSLDIYSTSMPSSINSICGVVDEFIRSLREGYGEVSDCTIFELKVILNEVLINAVRHGNGEDISKSVKVDASITEQGAVCITVEDEGSGYDYNQICSRKKTICSKTDPLEVNECGRGIMIVRNLCDKVKVNVKGNKIILTKNLNGE